MLIIERKTLTAKEAAQYLGVSYWLITQMVKRKQIPCARVGNRIMFRIETLDQYLKNQEENSVKQKI